MAKSSQCGGCGCSGGRRTRRGGQPETLAQMAKRLEAEEAKKAPTISELSAKIKARQEALKKSKDKKVGGTVVGDALLAGTALGLYSYFTRKRGGYKLPRRKTRKALV